MIKENISKKIQATENKMHELSLSLGRLTVDYQQLLDDLGLTADQLKGQVENADQFSPEAWQEIQLQQKKLDEKLNLELSHVKDFEKIEEAFAAIKNVQQHWLFVR